MPSRGQGQAEIIHSVWSNQTVDWWLYVQNETQYKDCSKHAARKALLYQPKDMPDNVGRLRMQCREALWAQSLQKSTTLRCDIRTRLVTNLHKSMLPRSLHVEKK